MARTVNSAVEQIADAIGDPLMQRVKRDHILNFINRASGDLRTSGWLLPIEPALVGLEANIYEYDVPLDFAYLRSIRLGSQSYGNAESQDTGVDTAEVLDASETGVDVTNSSIFAVNDVIAVEDEVMTVTAITSNTLTVRRGEFGTTAATHATALAVDRPMTDVSYDYHIPRPYWYPKWATGGMSADQAARGSRPVIVFHQGFLSFTADVPIQFHGQKRPTETYASGDSLDLGIESFVLERATAYASRFLFAQGDHPHLDVIFREAWAASEDFLRRQPQEFRVLPNSIRVPRR